MSFENKTVIVTGGDKGIGRAIAEEFAKKGANIVVAFARDVEAADKTVRMINELGAKPLSYKMDVRKKADCEGLVEEAVKNFGHLDIAINNAGVSTMNWAVDLTEQEWDYNMDVNAKGVFLCCQAEVKQFIKQANDGKIVNIASAASKRLAMLLSHYAASKFAVLGFSKSIALKVAQYKINVNCVCP